MTWFVNIVQYPDPFHIEQKIFPNKTKAEEFVKEFNKDNTREIVMVALGPFEDKS